MGLTKNNMQIVVSNREGGYLGIRAETLEEAAQILLLVKGIKKAQENGPELKVLRKARAKKRI
jgi:hypothetical protein